MRKTINALALAGTNLFLFNSCVPTRRWKESEAALQSVRNDSAQQAAKIHDLQSSVAQLNQQVNDLKQQVGDLNNKTGQLSTDAANKQSLLSKSQQELANQQKR